jgi:DNA-binding transcriptional ArsR family regulator
MLARLSTGEMSVGELSEPFSMSKPAITKHLKVLERAGLLSRNIIGREHQCQLRAEALNDAYEWVSFYRQFWTNKLDALDAFLQKPDQKTVHKSADKTASKTKQNPDGDKE